ncbi:tRNA (adenosine(37)-N6)-threonylcarbamoyltransferase complex ATPase subunit type 1 TsaE [Segetibacter sp. 3557_3]|uniref:tRNA (adenosine(37)-N6)-threonylcarbamoyltransferase complex ATPase subunit type 1 TsaE n=1 Tax=Segetibacter sp. 3557_3 TaxID=2547429 RepID=UPI00105853A4|nr:tRNA (adenosine(37)-N6)-threonylcarbamoyltransferase complex ATPase subunit type 1 TsaE [Segetibacter sp. 3557_3]TDH19837.1 tRNA (adenosine(37)-N6)-threonylcarbamoyltransferase complex ATPase subunit type 1 TsaE [Segetibacter sp. 3557_3]
MEISFTKASLEQVAKQVYALAKAYPVWAFHGAMGVGKTTFIHSLCDVLGVTSAVGSPTYAIINEYSSPGIGTIYHMDWYRLRDEEEAIQAGVEDPLYSNNLCLVEWPDRAIDLLPEHTLHLYLSIQEDDYRRISAPALA